VDAVDVDEDRGGAILGVARFDEVGGFGVAVIEAGGVEMAEESAAFEEIMEAVFGSHCVEVADSELRAIDAFVDQDRVGDVAEGALFHYEQGPGGGDVAEDEFPAFGPGGAGAGSAEEIDVTAEIFALGALEDDLQRMAGEDDFAKDDVAGGAAFQDFELIGVEFLEDGGPGLLPLFIGENHGGGGGPGAGEFGVFEVVAAPVVDAEAAEVAVFGGDAGELFAPEAGADWIGARHGNVGAEGFPGAEEIGFGGVPSDAVGEVEEVREPETAFADGVGVEEIKLIVAEEEVAEVQVGVT